MSQRFSFVLSELSTKSSNSTRHGAFHAVTIPPVAVAATEQRAAKMTRRNMPTNACNDTESSTDEPAASRHHIVTLDAPSLPKRPGFRNCLVCVACLWFFVSIIAGLTFLSLRPEVFLVLKRIPSHAFNAPLVPPTRAGNDPNKCAFSVFVNEGQPSRLQVHLALAAVVSPSLEEDDITVSSLSPGFFEVSTCCCSRGLQQLFETERIIAAWNAHLHSHYQATLVIAHAVEVIRPPIVPARLNASVKRTRSFHNTPRRP